ncbi:protein yippee-like At3g55890 [Brassica rapa]|nr:protein yippee-like At3g55890 [Brassica rapa]XP_013659884.2 protein yippee-like At3g55890 [Brassica napus]XP_048629201.1 protein yippee-like At3g55890 [Brassica napus]
MYTLPKTTPKVLTNLPLISSLSLYKSKDSDFGDHSIHSRETLLVVSTKMGRVFIVDLEGQIYSCKHCNTHLTKEQDIMSKSFQCRYGQAYLFNEVVNISTGNEEDRMLMTGLHTVTDIFCVGCGSNVGWKYVTAHDINQKYKEGKSVLELYKIVGPYDSNDLVCQEISRLEI